MNGVQSSGAFPATTVLRMTSDRPLKPIANHEADDLVLAAVTHPPRIGEPRPIAALMPQVLARYGIRETIPAQEITGTTIDLVA